MKLRFKVELGDNPQEVGNLLRRELASDIATQTSSTIDDRGLNRLVGGVRIRISREGTSNQPKLDIHGAQEIEGGFYEFEVTTKNGYSRDLASCAEVLCGKYGSQYGITIR